MLLLILLILQKIHVRDDRRQRSLKIMRDIRDKLRLHTLTLHFLVHSLLKPGLDLLDLLLERAEYSQILCDPGIKITLGDLSGGLKKHPIFPLQIVKILSKQ